MTREEELKIQKDRKADRKKETLDWLDI
jgi:hypothetical protein